MIVDTRPGPGMAQSDHEGRRIVGGLGQFEDGRGDLALQSQSFLNSVTELLVRNSVCVGNRSVVEVHFAACVVRPPFVNRPATLTRNRRPTLTHLATQGGGPDPAQRWGWRRRIRPSSGGQARFLKRQLSFPVSTMSQWWVRRSSSAVVIFASPKTVGHSPNARLVVTMTEVCS